MGVVKRSKFQHVSPLETGIDLPEPLAVESRPPSEPGDVQPEVRLPQSIRAPASPKKPSKKEEKYPKGQKKRQRYENNKYLLNLKSADDDLTDPCFTESCSKFATLLRQSDKMAAWNAFLTLSEDDQLAIVASNEVLAYFNNEAVLDQAPKAIVAKIANYRDMRRSMNADQAFRSLSQKLRSIFSKRHFPMGILVQLENEVLDFFLEQPKGTCVIERQCSFDRLIIHAISQFNVLYSQSFDGEGNRQTYIHNICPEFIPPAVSLSEYIQKKRRR